MKNRYLIYFVIAGLLLGSFYGALLHNNVGATWINDTGSYRKLITIIGDYPSGYQINFTVTNATTLDGHLSKFDFSDMFFTESDGHTLLPFWIENYISDTSCYVWVKMLINTTNSFYVYYGNHATFSMQSGNNTFNFFDDFSTVSLDYSKWSLVYGSSPISTSGILKIDDNWIYSIIAFTDNYAIRTLSKMSALNVVQQTGFGANILYAGSLDILNAYYSCGNYYDSSGDLYASSEDTLQTQVNTGAFDTNYHKVDIIRNGLTSVIFSNDEHYLANTPINTHISNNPEVVSLLDYKSTTGYALYDWIFVHKYISSFPTLSYGTEEPYPAVSCPSTSLTFIENLINCTGSHTYNYNSSSGYNIYNNYTGIGGNSTNITITKTVYVTSGVFSMTNDLLFLIVLMTLWIFFISSYFKEKSMMLGLAIFGVGLPLLIVISLLSLSYPFGFLIVFIIGILSLYFLIDGIYYRKSIKDKKRYGNN